MRLIIVESPTKARTLSKFLGSDYQIEATMGHLRDLPKEKLGIEIVKDNFIPQYEPVAKKKETIEKLKSLAKKAERIILATDPDREGEAIAYHVAVICSNDKSPMTNDQFDRIVFHEITESAIKEALQNPRQIDMNLVDAQQARRILDRLVGYKLSPLLWRKIRRGLSAGRVQSVAVRLIVEREREIKAFRAEEYWSIEAELQKTDKKNVILGSEATPESDSGQARMTVNKSQDGKALKNDFLATLISKNDKKLEIKSKDEAEQIVKELQTCSYQVKSVETGDLRKYPYPPFTTSTMQQAAANLFGWAGKQTMRVAQNLYEQGLITYHRTDSFNLAQSALAMCRSFIEKEYGKEYLPDKPKFYKTKSKAAQEAHEAIRPTSLSRHAEFSSASDQILKQVQNDKILDPQEERLYTLIWKRFVACQMKEAVYEETKVEIKAENYLFRTVGSKLKFDGWKRLYVTSNRTMEQSSNDEGEDEKTLPLLTINELLNLIKLLPSQHFTEPPARYNEASLIKTLEEKGIGRPSTYAPIISTIQERQYVEKLEKKFYPTVLGITVNDFLITNFPQELDDGFTAKMEDNLDEIAGGGKKWQPVLAEFYGPFSKKVEEVSKSSPRVQVPVEKTDQVCEKCGSAMVIRLGRFGKFLACSTFPKCKFTKSLINKTGLTCPKCGGEIVMKKTKKSRHFYGCGNYPKCDFASWRKEGILKSASQDNVLRS